MISFFMQISVLSIAKLNHSQKYEMFVRYMLYSAWYGKLKKKGADRIKQNKTIWWQNFSFNTKMTNNLVHYITL